MDVKLFRRYSPVVTSLAFAFIVHLRYFLMLHIVDNLI